MTKIGTSIDKVSKLLDVLDKHMKEKIARTLLVNFLKNVKVNKLLTCFVSITNSHWVA